MFAQISFVQMLYGFGLIFIMTIISFVIGLRLEKNLIIGTLRSFVQLLLLGHILQFLFKYDQPAIFIIAFFFMTLIASHTAIRRVGLKNFKIFSSTFTSIFLSTSLIGLYTLFLTIPQKPWYTVSKSIPIMGMILGNSLTSISLSLEKFLRSMTLHRKDIEKNLALGATPFEASKKYINSSLKVGLTPIINSMMVVGLVSIPGMMTGQILAGTTPTSAFQYQFLILLMICSSGLCSSVFVIFWNFHDLFNKKWASFNEIAYEKLKLI